MAIEDILNNLPDQQGGVSAVLDNLPDKASKSPNEINIPSVSRDANWTTFAKGAGIDESKAREYETATIDNLAFGIRPSESMRNRKHIDTAVAHNPTASRKRETGRNVYQGVSTIGAFSQYTTPEAEEAARVMIPSDRLTKEQILGYARYYRDLGVEQGGISEEEYQKVLKSDNPGSHLFNLDAVYTKAFPPTPRSMYDKHLSERIKEAPGALAGGVNLSLAGFFRGIQWLQGETGVNVGARSVADWLDENAEVALKGVRQDFGTDLWGAIGSMSTLVLPAAGVGKVARFSGLTERMALSLEMGSATVGEALMEAGGSYQNVLTETGNEEEAQKAARISFGANVALIAVTNRLGLYRNRYETTRSGLRGTVQAAAEGAKGEFAQEAGQEIIGQVAEGKPIDLDAAAYAGFLGAIVGAGTSALMQIASDKIDAIGPMPPEVERVYDETVQNGLDAGLSEEQAHVQASQAIQAVEGGPEYTDRVMQAQEAVLQADAAMGRDVPVPATKVTQEGIEDITAQVEAGTLTEDDAITQIMDRLIQPLTSEEGAVTIDRRDTVTISGEQFDLADPTQRERALDRGVELFRETGEIDMNSLIADEIIQEKLLLDELGTEGTAQTVMEARRMREIEARGQEQQARIQAFMQSQIAEEIRQQEIDRGVTLFRETGQIDLTSPIAIDVIKDTILNEAYTVRDNFSDILDIGRSIFAEGKAKFDEFSTRIKEVLGEAWEKVKPYLKTAWDVLNNEVGAIRLSPEGAPEFDLDNRIQAIRVQSRSKTLPAFMAENETWSAEEVNEALDKAQQGQPITTREAEIIHAALAEAGADFYQEAVEDEFITLDPEEVNEIVQKGIQDYVSKLEVVKPIELTAEQKRKKTRTQELRRRGNEIKSLQKQLKDTAYLLHQSVQDQASIRTKAKQDTREAREAIKSLESKIATRDKQIAQLREKAKGTARTLRKVTTKAQIRQTTGQVKIADLVREDVALREGLRKSAQAALKASREGRKEGVAAERARMQEMVAQAQEQMERERSTRKGVARYIKANLPPGVRGQFIEALTTAKTPADFSRLSERVDDAIVKFDEAKELRRNLATKRQKLSFIKKIGEFNQTAISEIKQEVGLDKPLTKATEAQLLEITEKLKARLRFKRSRGFNPQIEDRDSKRPEILDTVYRANRALSEGKKKGFIEKLAELKKAAGDTIDKYLGTISSRLADINPSLRNALRKLEFNLMQQVQKDRKATIPFLEKSAKMDKVDHYDFDLALKNGDTRKINEIVEKYDMVKEYETIKSLLDDVYSRAKEVGFDIGYQQNYFPRMIKDSEGFLQWFSERDDWSIIHEAIQKKEMHLGRVLTLDEKVHMINTMIRGYSGGNITLSETGAMKQRVIDFVSPELNQFYEDSLSTLGIYLEQTDTAIEQRKFFGKHRAMDESLEEANNLDDSLGYYIADLIAKGEISPAQEKEVKQIFQARFGERGTHGIVGLYKNASYLSILGDIFSAITQIGDMAFSLYSGGAKNVLTALPKAVIGKSIITKEDIGIERIVAEVENKSKMAEMVDRVFRLVGLTKIDAIGKETLINASILRRQTQARNTPDALKAELEPIFGDETEQVIEDLKNDVVSENVKYLAFNTLLNFQPIALSEVPEAYLTGGNGRIFYTMKTWQLKMMDVFRNEVFRTMETDKPQAIRNMIRLSVLLVLMNGTADVIKKILRGDDFDDDDVAVDLVIDNILKLIGFSRYSVTQAQRDGIGSAVIDQITPPTNILDDITKDVIDLYKDPITSESINDLRSIRNIPVVGELYYYWFGRRANRDQGTGGRRQ